MGPESADSTSSKIENPVLGRVLAVMMLFLCFKIVVANQWSVDHEKMLVVPRGFVTNQHCGRYILPNVVSSAVLNAR